MTRRIFISKSASAALVGGWMLSGCGGGGGGGASGPAPESRNAGDRTVESLQRRNDTLTATMEDFRRRSSETVEGGASGRSFLRSGTSDTSRFFKEYGHPFGEGAYGIPHYFSSRGDVWKAYVESLDVAAGQYRSQFMKMNAALRAAGYRSGGSVATGGVSARAVTKAKMVLRDTDTGALENFNELVEQLASGNFTETIANLLTVSLAVLKSTLETLLSQDRIKGLAYTVLTYLAVDRLLELVKEKSLSDLNFLGDQNIVISLGKMVIAALALLGLMSLSKLAPGTSVRSVKARAAETADDEELQAFLRNVITQGKLVTVLFGFVTKVLGEMTADTLATGRRLMEIVSDPAYTLTEEDAALIEKLKVRSKVLAVFGLALKALFGLLASNQNALFTDADGNPIGFSDGGDARKFDILFGSAINPYDETFNAYLHGLIEQMASDDGSDSGMAAILEVMEGLSTQAYNFAVHVETDAYNFTSSTEHDAYTFASRLANLAYQFTAGTEHDAYAFATHMADLAYSFTMKIEDDAYHFALQGMEWGYLFASRGEEVGIMADRVLWMAVQIGQMADRIGEMADRIVYTEQLIVYTETLILDFGLLIYGGMKIIANFVLMGLALILDRKWYEPETEDAIVNLIGSNVEQMMANMQEYALAVLENQNTLRQTTLDALEWILQMEAMQQGEGNTTDTNATS